MGGQQGYHWQEVIEEQQPAENETDGAPIGARRLNRRSRRNIAGVPRVVVGDDEPELGQVFTRDVCLEHLD